jgi:ABC-type uncharacterized transport system ATPase subunit
VAVRARPLHAAREALRNVAGVATASMFGETLHVALRERDRQSIVESALAKADVAIESIEAVEPSLEDVFINLVAGRAHD